MTVTSLWFILLVMNVFAVIIKAVLSIFAFEVHWRLQPTVAQLIVRCTSCRSTTRELSANDWEETTANYLSKFESPGDIISVERCRKLIWKLHLVSELKVALKKIWYNSRRSQLIKLLPTKCVPRALEQ